MYDEGSVACWQVAGSGGTGVGGAAYYGGQVFIKAMRPLPLTLITPLTSLLLLTLRLWLHLFFLCFFFFFVAVFLNRFFLLHYLSLLLFFFFYFVV